MDPRTEIGRPIPRSVDVIMILSKYLTRMKIPSEIFDQVGPDNPSSHFAIVIWWFVDYTEAGALFFPGREGRILIFSLRLKLRVKLNRLPC